MESDRKIIVVSLTLILFSLITLLKASPVSDTLVNSELDGKALIKMGQVLNKPMLTLLGQTFVKMKYSIDKQVSEKIGNVENKFQDDINTLTKETASERKTLKTELCTLKKCTEWTEWTECSARIIRTFGASTRSRTCGGSSSICPSVVEKEEMDSRICQGSLECKSKKYTITSNQFCIRLSNTVQKTWTAAQKECHQDGGHLINVDSELKTRDVNETLEKISFTDSLWIDGRRTLPNGEWIYEYGPEDAGFSNWYGSEPDSIDDCRAYGRAYSGIWYWYGRPCTRTYYFLCEMV